MDLWLWDLWDPLMTCLHEIVEKSVVFRYSKCQPFKTVLYVSKNDQFSKLICKLTWLSATGLVDEFIDVVAKFIRL